jgi:hypothetical protein
MSEHRNEKQDEGHAHHRPTAAHAAATAVRDSPEPGTKNDLSDTPMTLDGGKAGPGDDAALEQLLSSIAGEGPMDPSDMAEGDSDEDSDDAGMDGL